MTGDLHPEAPDEAGLVETVVGVFPPGRYRLRQQADGMIELVQLWTPAKRGQGFWKGLEQLE